jgi:signal transduction histidine kinase
VWVTLERTFHAGIPALVLLVEDDGPGIAPGDLTRIFEAGFTTQVASTGRGLAIVHALALQAGGEVSAENRVLGGARLRIALPIAAGDDLAGQDDPSLS